MTEILALVGGATLGAFFFGGLWWTVVRGAGSPRPAFWFVSSFLVRTGVVLVGFYWLATAGDWQRLLLALFGFFIARLIVTYLTQEGRHAPQS